MSEPQGDPDLLCPDELRRGPITLADAESMLKSLGHPRARRWLQMAVEDGGVQTTGDPAGIDGAGLWRALLTDECDKLYNQAWCALDQIQSADDPEETMFLAMDDLPSAVEQAYSLAPSLAGEHLALLRGYKVEKHDDLLRELAVGTDREAEERIDCLAFWEENAEDITALRRTLFRLVREALVRRVAR